MQPTQGWKRRSGLGQSLQPQLSLLYLAALAPHTGYGKCVNQQSIHVRFYWWVPHLAKELVRDQLWKQWGDVWDESPQKRKMLKLFLDSRLATLILFTTHNENRRVGIGPYVDDTLGRHVKNMEQIRFKRLQALSAPAKGPRGYNVQRVAPEDLDQADRGVAAAPLFSKAVAAAVSYSADQSVRFLPQ